MARQYGNCNPASRFVTVAGAAHGFGAPPENIIQKINDPANTVAPILPGGVEKMRAAGVPDTVIAAMQAKAMPAPQPVQPDNPALARYVELARLLTGQSHAAVEDGIAWVRALCHDLGIPGLM